MAMPLGMLVGVLLCREVAWLEQHTAGMLTPTFIFLMLFFTFCRVDARKIRFSGMHIWLMLFQIVGSVAVYWALSYFSPVVAQGGMICVLDEGQITNIATLPEFRRRGLAEKTLSSMLDEAKKRELSFSLIY
jgi:ribosomal protein S18 acetylase RimI-like enzyme